MTKYALMYRLGFTPWERYGAAGGAQLGALLDREAAERPAGPGRALDVGCGRGQFTPVLAARGWAAVGVDIVPEAVEAARRKGPAEVNYVVGDVTDLESAGLGTFDLFVDIGCFQGLDAGQRAAEGRGITALAAPGAGLLMLAFGPSRYRGLVEGVSQAEVEAAFPGWDLREVEDADTAGLGWPMNRTSPKWYRFRRAAG
ncbi:class I SAM-dependent methyltransferase [Streptomonospora sp. S1-112]|uniref:Class I SAM-dependent methyltransferase n=1 Tax=Streptomonospora mangrovi TaxID=2883123 RepID=A0A9X3SF58_9ACTN|nr:class I SAM-dependent methyltransferase [Streptomonospora mangrovi]MDA0564480.1 class I SAM-dependent methyltransferase [Streptomonospora mangrovi]